MSARFASHSPWSRACHQRRLGLLALGLLSLVVLTGLSTVPAQGHRAPVDPPTALVAPVSAPAAPTEAAGQVGAAADQAAATPQVNGYLRIIDGDSIDTLVDGRQTAIGIIGVNAPVLNGPCGKEAKAFLQQLVKGGVDLVEESSYPFDARKRRMYYLTRKADAKDLAKELVKEGYGKADDKHKDKDELKQLEKAAKDNKKGCLWKAGLPLAPNTAPPGGTAPAPSASPSAAPAPRTDPALAGTGIMAALAPGFTDDLVANGLTNPTAFTLLPDGRILAAEKWGVVRVIKNGTLLPTPFIDLRAEVNDYWDRGMIGIAADPNFATTGYVYLLYTYENNAADYTGTKTSRLTRVTALPPSSDTASPATKTTILGTQVGSACTQFPAGADCIPAEWVGHSVGTVRFAADGTLFLTNGDATTWNTIDPDALRAQDVTSLAGKVIHITAAGQGVSTNPFWNGNAGANQSKVWALGLRNPYRFGIRPANGVPYLGDVGWGNWEEVDVATKGANLGWPCYEAHDQLGGYNTMGSCPTLYGQGTAKFGLVEYDHYPGGQAVSSAVTGGAFYSGTSYPSQYQGAFFYGDYGRGFIRYVLVDANDTLVAGPTDFTTGAGTPVDILMGLDGNLWYLAINLNGTGGGEVHRVRYTAAPPPPLSPFLSDRPMGTATNGWGPVELDQSNGDLAGGDGRTIALRGTTYAKGLGMHANADVHYALGGACTRFAADVGVDDEVSGAGSVIFRVYLDGATTPAYDSGTVTGTSAAKPISLNITGKNDLRLVVNDASDGIDSDHGDWANARIYCSDFSDTTAPTVTATVPASGATGVATGTVVTATFSEAIDPFTLTAATVTLVRQGTIPPLPATITSDGVLNKVTLQPTAALTPGITYTVTVKGGAGGAKDLAGNPLAADKVWSFTTNGNSPPTATISQLTLNGTPTPPASLRYKVGDTIGFSGSATDPEDGTIPASGLGWQVIIHHCPGGSCHTHILTTASGASGSVVMPDHGDDSSLELVLTATDSGGLQGTAAVTLQPQTVQLTLATAPIGLQLTYTTGSGVDTVTGPTTRTTIVGSQHTINAPSPQGSSTFTSWSDSGAQQHTITIGAASTILTATFSGGGGGSTTTYLSDLTWASMTNGCGPVQKDRSTGNCGVGGTLKLRGTTYTKGLGAHAASDVRYALPAGCTAFLADVGVDDETGGNGSVAFQVFLDGATTPARDSGVVRGTSPVQSLTVDVTGKTTLRLVVTDGGDGIDSDHADWANARIVCGGADTTPPTVTSTTPAAGATGVATGTVVTATFSEAMDPATLTTTTVTVRQGTNPPVTATVTYTSSSLQVTLQPSAALAANTVYTATVKGGTGGAKDVAGNALAADKVWSFTTGSGVGTTTYLSDLTWTSMTNGCGPVMKDRSTGNCSVGGTLKLRGTTYTKGLGAHAASDVRYTIGGTCSTFAATVGVDDETGGNGSVVFRVYLDGATTPAYDSGVVRGTTAVKTINLNITGKTTLRLVVTNGGDNIDFDHADWANARITCT